MAMAMRYKSTIFLAAALVATLAVQPNAVATEPTIIRDIAYTSSSGDPAQRLDLYRPADLPSGAPLIIWVHGGAWRSGFKSDVPIASLLSDCRDEIMLR